MHVVPSLERISSQFSTKALSELCVRNGGWNVAKGEGENQGEVG